MCFVRRLHQGVDIPAQQAEMLDELQSLEMLAHRGFQPGIFVAEEIAGLAPIPVQDHQVPRVTYTHPEVASVGFDETAANERYGQISSTVYDLAGIGGSQFSSDRWRHQGDPLGYKGIRRTIVGFTWSATGSVS